MRKDVKLSYSQNYHDNPKPEVPNPSWRVLNPTSKVYPVDLGCGSRSFCANSLLLLVVVLAKFCPFCGCYSRLFDFVNKLSISYVVFSTRKHI